MIVHGVDFAEGRPHLPNLAHKSRWQRGKRNVALFQVDALFSERNEEISARVWVNDRLEAHLGLVHLEGGDGLKRYRVLL